MGRKKDWRFKNRDPKESAFPPTYLLHNINFVDWDQAKEKGGLETISALDESQLRIIVFELQQHIERLHNLTRSRYPNIDYQSLAGFADTVLRIVYNGIKADGLNTWDLIPDLEILADAILKYYQTNSVSNADVTKSEEFSLFIKKIISNMVKSHLR